MKDSSFKTSKHVITPMKPPKEDGPSHWDLLIDRLGIRKRDEVRTVEENSDRGEIVREFVRKNCRQKFVPLKVLRMMGLEEITDRYFSGRQM